MLACVPAGCGIEWRTAVPRPWLGCPTGGGSRNCHGEFAYGADYEEFDFWETATEFFDSNSLPG